MSDDVAPDGKGWFVVEHTRNVVMRGPYRHVQTAGAVRDEMERWMSDSQNERWNLWVELRPLPECIEQAGSNAETLT